ncbi:diaminopimelate decarboxylase [Halorarum halobium]|uniref:diaminopimelate decarboxylase n=1 Tax=Halorarum halobium TaxID=3075121 RepID=UPI0028A716D5|nr:diaminopimelate decarboxylase [Halobaculum sp. XH14]
MSEPDADEPTDGTGSPGARRLADWNEARLRELAAEHGTPLYVTDLDRVAQNCARFRAAFPDASLRYAVKANAGRAVLETVREAGFGAECASAGEVGRALEAGFGGDDVDYTAVNPPARDLDAVVDWWRDGADLTVTVGAADTLDRLRERGYDGRLCVRVNPGVGAGHHEKVRTGAAAKFGVPAERVDEVVADARADFEFVGLHAHAGSGIHDEADLAAHREFLASVAELAAEVGDLEYVNVGGGVGVPYRETESPLDLDAVATAVREELSALDAAVALEPGRYLVADAAVLVTRVNTVKPSAGEVVAGVDAGMTDLLRPAMYDAFHAIRLLDPGADEREERPVTVAGPICESGDTFCEGRPLPAPERGDLLALGNAGAYGYEMASTYNSRPRPADVSPEGDVLRRRESLADLTVLER